jgi:regulator of Ty1 transposition protein 103
VKQKIKRVIDVWAQRNVFDPSVLDEMKAKLESATVSGGTASGGAAGLFGGGGLLGLGGSSASVAKKVAPQVVKLDGLYQELSHKSGSKTIDDAVAAHKALFESDTLPEPAEYAEKLNDIGLKLGSAKQMLTDRRIIRDKIAAELEFLSLKIKEDNDKDKVLLDEVTAKTETTEDTKAEVLEMVKSGLGPETYDNNGSAADTYVPPGASADIDLDAAPAYSPLSDEDDNGIDEYEPQPKKPKVEESTQDTAGDGASQSGLEGLDPAVAALLSNMTKS